MQISALSSRLMVALVLISSFWCAGVAQGADVFPWPNGSADRAKCNSLSPETVGSFLTTLLAKNDLPRVTVQEFRFTSLSDNGYQLVATIDSSGRLLFDNVIVVFHTANGPFEYKVVSSFEPHLLASELLDLDGTGKSLLVLKQLVGGYQGSRNAPIFWYDLMTLSQNELVKVSARYPAFYQKRSCRNLLSWSA